MLKDIASLLVDVAVSFFVWLMLARFLFQWLRVPFRNPFGDFVIATTNWMVLPARRVVPPLFGLDLASCLCAWILQTLGLALQLGIAGRDLFAAPEISAGVIAAFALLDLVRYTLYIFVIVLIVQAVLSWINPYSPLAPIFDALTRPFLRPIRRRVPPLANVDLSPLVLIVVLQVLLIPLAHLRQMIGSLF